MTACLAPSNHGTDGQTPPRAELSFFFDDMDISGRFADRGFDRVAVLDGKQCGIEQKRLILAFMTYEPVEEQKVSGALIHPYYPVSQRAYRAAGDIAASLRKEGLDVQQANHIHIKSILGRLPFLRRGRNTLSYMGVAGSRFHVQILTADEEIPVTDDLYETEREYSCGKCRRCMSACPGGAITDDGFERERCLRYWMLNGELPPDEIKEKMGSRLIGCDVCEACCPMNRPGTGEPEEAALEDLLEGRNIERLRMLIGSNYARKRKLLIQACLIAGSTRRKDLLDKVREAAEKSGDPAVKEAAAWAESRMEALY